MFPVPVSGVTASGKPGIDVKKLTQSAHQFEAILINTLLRPLEQTLSGLPGTTSQPGSDAYNSLGTEALAKGLVAKGGLGIAKIIVDKVLKNHPVAGTPAPTPRTKDFSRLGR